MKILLAVDGSACSDAAVNEVAARPWPEGSEVKIISVIELPFTPTEETRSLPGSDYSGMERAGREQAQTAINRAAERLRDRDGEPLTITAESVIGRAEDSILDAAEEWGADLIVLGSHGYRGFKRFLLGSVALAVATYAKCSAEIVRNRVADNDGRAA
ncbi:MAG TPA: universal stress protein [Blastocatellia bacterium]|nr:universal stress protein [Blastocatellia bacterium]